MNKRIIFCADGTWDSTQNDTNVFKMYQAIAISSTQVVFYDDGVGSDGDFFKQVGGGAFGDGLCQKIRDGYTKIAHVYNPGDDIFIFGFSRGAYTARSLAGMIAICGLPAEGFDDTLVNDAFQAYRNPGQRAVFDAKYNLFDAKIKMVGVWDTVGALGIPAIFGGVAAQYGFLDTGLHPDVANAFHALSIDERRQEFPPTLWTSVPAQGQVLQQVWFSGVHCDVGGGYTETGLSDTTFAWMLKNATGLGLQVNNTVTKYLNPVPAWAMDTLHDSWSPLWLFPKPRTVPDGNNLSNTVSLRCQYADNYQPGNLNYQPPTDTPVGYQIVTVTPDPFGPPPPPAN